VASLAYAYNNDSIYRGINNTPLHRHQEAATLKAYIRQVVALLAMLIRTDEDQAYHIPFPASLQRAIQDLKGSLQNEDGIMGSLHGVLTEVWMVNWIKTADNPIPCPTERLIALQTLDADGGHKEPKLVTGLLAKLEYCIRLACLKEMKVQSINGNDEAALNLLQPWFTEKTNSTFSRIRSLQHRATSIAYGTMSLPRIWWVDRKQWQEMLYKGEKVHIDCLRRMFSSMENKLVDIWEKKVLAGISIRICYQDLKDDNTNHDVGYSFLLDRRNACFADRNRFLKAIIDNQEVFGKFTVFRNGQLIWNRGALLQWLRDYAEFQKLILSRCEMLSGSPGRGTELTAMTYRNTKVRLSLLWWMRVRMNHEQTRSQRNLVMLGKHLTMLRIYHKSGALSGLDKLIPHSIDGVTADLMIQDLALTRPFAEIAAYVCYPDKPEIKEMYQTNLFVNNTRLFDTEQLSATMSRESIAELGFGLQVNSWRHISTAFKRKLGRFAEELLEEDGQDTVEALQAGHTRSTENRIYGLSPDALAGAPEDLLPLFLQASTNWQLLMRTVPGGLGLPYAHASAHNFKKLAESGKLGIDIETEQAPVAQLPSPAEVSLLTEAMANRIADKLEDTLVKGLEERLVKRVADALTPALEAIIKNAIKEVVPQEAPLPTNDVDMSAPYDVEEAREVPGKCSNQHAGLAYAYANLHLVKMCLPVIVIGVVEPVSE